MSTETETKRPSDAAPVELALQASEERLRRLVTGAPLVLWAIDCEGVITLAEGKGLERLGYASGGLVGKSIYLLYDRNPILAESIRQCLLSGVEEQKVAEVRGVVFETRLSPTFQSGTVTGLIGVSIDITERTRAEEALRGLSRQMWAIQEEERRRIARELHDEAAQATAALKMHLDTARRETDPALVRAHLDEAAKLAGGVLEEIRRIACDLRPGALEELGLVPALRALGEDFQRRTGTPTTFVGPSLPWRRTDPDCETAVYRFVQEALTNVQRHARGAGQVVVSLEHEPGSVAVVRVKDDGPGFDPVPSPGHLGLVGMQERARMLGGRVQVESHPGAGARLTMEIPIPPRA